MLKVFHKCFDPLPLERYLKQQESCKMGVHQQIRFERGNSNAVVRKCMYYRSSCAEVFYEKGVFEKFAKFNPNPLFKKVAD